MLEKIFKRLTQTIVTEYTTSDTCDIFDLRIDVFESFIQ